MEYGAVELVDGNYVPTDDEPDDLDPANDLQCLVTNWIYGRHWRHEWTTTTDDRDGYDEMNGEDGYDGEDGPETLVITVVEVDGANKFKINDTLAADGFELMVGQTYMFDQSDPSNSGHPVFISTTEDGPVASGGDYIIFDDYGDYIGINVSEDTLPLHILPLS